MASFEIFAPKLKRLEGGYVNHPSDPGGATMAGVTFEVYKRYCSANGLPSPTLTDLKNISNKEWSDIMKSGYWDKLKADQINNQSIAEISSDWLVNSGVGKIKNLQAILGVSVDGIVGQNTINAFNSANQLKLFNDIKRERTEFYYNIVKNKPSSNVFLNGWLNRLKEFNFSE